MRGVQQRARQSLAGPQPFVEEILPEQFQAELYQARLERTRRLAEVATGDPVCKIGPCCAAGQLEVGMVQEVEHFDAELEVEPLRHLNVLEQRLVRRPLSRPQERVPA